MLRFLTLVWIALILFMSREYLILHNMIEGKSWIKQYSCQYLSYCGPMSPRPGKPLSYYLGWLGFSIMCLTNLYIIRKRAVSMRNLGTLSGWLDWHIFFGLVGPTFILFHCDFKVGGLVAISFWSMMISFSSGIVGRYMYRQLLENKTELRERIKAYEGAFQTVAQAHGTSDAGQRMEWAKSTAFFMAGGVTPEGLGQLGLTGFLYRSAAGKIRMFYSLPPAPWQAPRELRIRLKEWAILRKKLLSMHVYKILFGYWHAFHLPFAIFMYVVAIIHIISSLIFRTNT